MVPAFDTTRAGDRPVDDVRKGRFLVGNMLHDFQVWMWHSILSRLQLVLRRTRRVEVARHQLGAELDGHECVESRRSRPGKAWFRYWQVSLSV